MLFLFCLLCVPYFVFVHFHCVCVVFVFLRWLYNWHLSFWAAQQETLMELNCCLIKMKFTLPLFLSKLHALKASGRLDGCECCAPYTSYFDTCKEPTSILPIWGYRVVTCVWTLWSRNVSFPAASLTLISRHCLNCFRNTYNITISRRTCSSIIKLYSNTFRCRLVGAVFRP
jgi:hypothetical protein